MSTPVTPEIPFQPVRASLAELVGLDFVDAACRARAALTGESLDALQALATESVEFLPAVFLERQQALLARVGERLVEVEGLTSAAGAATRAITAASQLGRAPLSACGWYRVGEDGRLYLISKSEHYHASLGHGFPGFALVERARQLGLPNATHNNTRGRITRRLEEQLVAAVHGLDSGDQAGMAAVMARRDLYECNRVLNLETGSLAVEAALKLLLARFYRAEAGSPEPPHAGCTPVLLVIGNDEGGLQANYHGTTILTQTLRGMWPELHAGLEQAGLYRVVPLRPNCVADLEAAFSRWDGDGHRLAGFFHEIVMMNYGARLLTREFLQRAHALCRAREVPTVVDEIQSCAWHHDLFLFREWGLQPSCVVTGKGFPGGEYPASRLIFSAALDILPQFGALVTNGQEELASLAYLITMRWARANADATRQVGDFYESRLRDFAARHRDQIAGVEGKRHMTALCFRSLAAAKAFAAELNARGLDISAQTYKADAPPALLTKLPLIATPALVDFVLARFESVMQTCAWPAEPGRGPQATPPVKPELNR